MELGYSLFERSEAHAEQGPTVTVCCATSVDHGHFGNALCANSHSDNDRKAQCRFVLGAQPQGPTVDISYDLRDCEGQSGKVLQETFQTKGTQCHSTYSLH